MNNPTYATVTPAGQSLYTWATPPFSAGQALLVPPAGISRIAAAWYSSTSFTIDVNVAAGHSYDLELYFVDYDAHGRAETVTLTDSSTDTTLNSQSISNFASGEYLVWTISGNVLITISALAGINAVLDGLFFDPAGPPLPPPPPTATASFLATDTTTQGNWIGVYGNQGFNVLGSGVSNPTGDATVTPSGQSLYTWATPPFYAGGALQVPPAGTSRIAAAWYSSTSFTIDVNLAAGYAYNLELYFLDYVPCSRPGRARKNTSTASNGHDAEYPEHLEFTSEWRVSDLDDIRERADHDHAHSRCQRSPERFVLHCRRRSGNAQHSRSLGRWCARRDRQWIERPGTSRNDPDRRSLAIGARIPVASDQPGGARRGAIERSDRHVERCKRHGPLAQRLGDDVSEGS